MPSLEQWIELQWPRAAGFMLASVSPLGVVKARPGFGQVIRPVRGAIVASPVPASYDPDPDYFFHWFRDSALVIDALRLLRGDAQFGPDAAGHFGDFVRFSLSLRSLDGAALAGAPGWRERVAPDFRQYLREDLELAAVRGDAVYADTRVNPDGSLDISRWSRPQHDGPPLRALALLRWLDGVALAPDVVADAVALLRLDLAFALQHWREPGFDIWEEERGEHYYTLSLSAAALQRGAAWLEARGEAQRARECRRASEAMLARLDGFWLPEAGHYRSRVLEGGARSAKELDISVILAAIHAGLAGPAHSVRDPRMHATLGRLEDLFDASYPINRAVERGRGTQRGPAMGRYEGDVYYSGGAYYFSTLGAAEFCYRAAGAGGPGTQQWLARGDAYLQTVRRHTPPSGEMSEQFDQATGAQTSARHLAWSYAAFLSCVAARRSTAASSPSRQFPPDSSQ